MNKQMDKLKFNQLLLVFMIILGITAAYRVRNNEVKDEMMINKCSKNSMSEVDNQIRSTSCKPRPTIVPIETIQHHTFLMSPPAVTVNRCDGFCRSGKACMPTAMSIVNKTVRWHDAFTFNEAPMCGIVMLEEHLACSCKCSIVSADCSSIEIYKKRDCMCECNNKTDMINCNHRKGWQWNHAKCKCECATEEKCSTGYEWISRRCGCGMVERMAGE